MRKQSFQRAAWALCLAAALIGAAAAAGGWLTADFASLAPGASVVGPGAVHPLLNIHNSGGNDVIVVKDGLVPAAYGAPNVIGGSIANNGIGAGFTDAGDPSQGYVSSSRKHQYVFTFADGVLVDRFSVRMLDWGDYLPFGAAIDGKCAFRMVGYDAAGNEVDSDEISFTSTGADIQHRVSNEFGDLATAGDAISSQPGQPGNYTFEVAGANIARVELHAADHPSLDPLIGFTDLKFEVQPIRVAIDIKPGTYPNPINYKARGLVPVAVLSSATFDARTVVPGTAELSGVPVSLKGNGAPQASLADVNGDGLPDLVLQFPVQGLPVNATSLTLTAETTGGSTIAGSDTVRPVP